MAKSKSARRRRREQQRTPIHFFEPAVRHHLEALQMRSVEAYLSWCTEHNFPRAVHKSAIQRERERAFARRASCNAALTSMRRERVPRHGILRAIAAGGDGLPTDLAPVAQLLQESHTSSIQRGFCRELVTLIAHRAPRLLAPRGAGRAPLATLGTFLSGLVRMANVPRVRSLDSWRPRSRNDSRALLSLAHHLFARWPTPPCLDQAWFDASEDGEPHRRWFVALGAGASVRSIELPIVCTRRIAHHFANAPRDYTVPEALRYAQVIASGGTLAVAEALRGTRLVELPFDHEDFWSTVVSFLARHEISSPGEAGAIVDYVQVMRFGTEPYVGADGRTHRDPPEFPELSLAGRTPRSLLRDVEAWHRRLGVGIDDGVTWEPSGLPGYRSASADGSRVTTVRELLSGGELRREGSRMRHCVATYAGLCKRGRSSIWAIEERTEGALHKLLTVEVRNDLQRVVQAQGKCNADPCPQARSVLERWARGAKLELPSWI